MAKLKWQEIATHTDVLKVFGGWIVRYTDHGHNEKGSLALSASMCFIPDGEYKWVRELNEIIRN